MREITILAFVLLFVLLLVAPPGEREEDSPTSSLEKQEIEGAALSPEEEVDPTYCEQDSDCVVQYYDYCCLEEWRYTKGCFHKDHVALENLSCEGNGLCMSTPPAKSCLCVENVCTSVIDRDAKRKIDIGAHIGKS